MREKKKIEAAWIKFEEFKEKLYFWGIRNKIITDYRLHDYPPIYGPNYKPPKWYVCKEIIKEKICVFLTKHHIMKENERFKINQYINYSNDEE